MSNRSFQWLDFRPYINGIRVPALSAQPLAIELRKAAQQPILPEADAALSSVEEHAEGVQVVLDDRDRASSNAVRPSFDACRGAWVGLITTLDGKTHVSPEVSSVGKEAEGILAGYFPDGAAFTLKPAHEMWSEARRRLRRMEREGAVERITALVGAELVESVRTTTSALGEVLNIGESTREPAPAGDALREKMFLYGRALGRYGRVMAARVDEGDPASVEAFRKAMAPIEQYRSRVTGEGGEDEEGGDEPEVGPSAPSGGSPQNGGGPFTQ